MSRPQTLGALVRENARTRPEHPYLHFEGATHTYADLDTRTNVIASALAADGVGVGDRVALLDKNTPLHFEVMFAAAKCGAVFVPVNWRLAPAEAQAVLADCDPSVVIVGEEFAPALGDVVDELGVRSLVPGGTAVGPFAPVDRWLDGHADGSDPGVELGPSDIALQLYTSGTTGLPKGVLLSNNNLLGRLAESAELWGYDPGSVNIVVSPLFHIGGTGVALLGMTLGATTVMVRMVDPALILRLIDEFGVTNGLFVPAIIAMLLDTPGCERVNWSTMRTLMYGASPISDPLLRRAMSVMGCDFLQLYGITEHSGCLTYLAPEDHDPDHRPGLLRSCGKPLPWVELKVIDPVSLAPVATGEVGEIAVRSTQVMRGYWRQPDETGAVITEDGWFRTGDAGYLDEAGYLYLHDRTKDMIVSGGENIFPAEIENVIMHHPAVADAAVIGVPHERWGEAPHAVLVLPPGVELDEELERGVIALCRERLGSYKCPRSLEAVGELPRNAAGKVLKRELRERAWAGHERRIG
jgi:long-chain acyl-CoA synthetase